MKAVIARNNIPDEDPPDRLSVESDPSPRFQHDMTDATII